MSTMKDHALRPLDVLGSNCNLSRHLWSSIIHAQWWNQPFSLLMDIRSYLWGKLDLGWKSPTYPPLSLYTFSRLWGSIPIWVSQLLNKAIANKFAYLIFQGFISFGIKDPHFLSISISIRIDLEMVVTNLWIDTNHALLLPCEDIKFVTQESSLESTIKLSSSSTRAVRGLRSIIWGSS